MKPLLTVAEAHAYTGLSVSTLNKMRCTGEGPNFVRLGKRRVAYPQDELDAWIKARIHASTSEYETPAPSPKRKANLK